MKNLQKAEDYLKFIKNMNANKDTEGVLEITEQLLKDAGACLLKECEYLRGNNKGEIEGKINSSMDKLEKSINEGTVYLVQKELENITGILNSNLAVYNIDLFSPVWQTVSTEGTTYLTIENNSIIVYCVSDSGAILSIKELYVTKYNKSTILKMLSTEISATGAEVDIMDLASQVMFLLTNN